MFNTNRPRLQPLPQNNYDVYLARLKQTPTPDPAHYIVILHKDNKRTCHWFSTAPIASATTSASDTPTANATGDESETSPAPAYEHIVTHHDMRSAEHRRLENEYERHYIGTV
ncbi:hypothetical protein BJY04DRAFT_224882 [Aspergillus karnatakaensis]|uniref:uncharacterized protein n=1 Tax=Aspergillus karnatakaensis TaxID=1810916 RepID=UPI003CCDF9C6